ncbi:aminoglycoside phosphotransferase family protein [Streptomyces justiciae]|uniref:Aminoglycoside phosphotransferase family protein n=1 Tax=Streptomyces justiciae TaxID=2780140 RepID=A0ABU3LS30_9ACTN|nr:aminoglycoside phosphotransferase family protein [Streptomyces justiciae]MDT7841631.1 aminoglycoside phosphotransferase family protein [Streptomyces justiciae]
MKATAPSSVVGQDVLLPPGRRYLALPSRRHPIVVAEDRPQVMAYLRRSLLAMPPTLPGWLYPAARTALLVPAVRRCVPGLSVDRQRVTVAPSPVADLLAGAGPLLLLHHSHDPDACTVVLVFPPNGALPALALKVPTGPGAVPGILREADRLTAVAALPLGPVRPTVPEVLDLPRHTGLPTLLTTALPGTSMLAAYHRPGHHARPAPVHRDFAAAAHWLAALQSATSAGTAPLDLAPKTFDTLDERLAGERIRAELRFLRRRLRRCTAPLTAAHGDFWPGNVLVHGDRVTGVVDWENARTAGSPLADPARFVVAYCEYLDRRTRPGHRVPGHPDLVAGRPGAALALALDGVGWYPRLVRHFLDGTLRRLGLPTQYGRDAVVAEVAAIAAEATDPEFADAQVRAFTRLVSSREPS